ncbi:MAG: histidine kinase [Chitinophagaceae bacterium]
MVLKALVEKSYSNKYWRAGLHLLFWVSLFSFNYYFNSISFNSFNDNSTTFLLSAKNTFTLVVVYYSLMYFILPSFFYKRKFGAGIISVLLLLLVYAFLDAYGDKQIITNCSNCMVELVRNNQGFHDFLERRVIDMMAGRTLSLGLVYQLVILLSLPVAVKVGRSYFRQTVQKLQLSRDNLQLEFNFLKSQINPHFLFNTLNNIYSLVVHDKKQQAATTIARLSGFMRYTLYECNEDKIGLEKEIQLFRDYIELEQLRLNKTEVKFNYSADHHNYMVPPLLFMPALENAFKYSADNLPDSFINIDIFVKEKQMIFKIANRFDPAKTGKPGGIGLVNLQKRLQFYYPGCHSYSVVSNAAVYSMEVTCNLS